MDEMEASFLLLKSVRTLFPTLHTHHVYLTPSRMQGTDGCTVQSANLPVEWCMPYHQSLFANEPLVHLPLGAWCGWEVPFSLVFSIKEYACTPADPRTTACAALLLDDLASYGLAPIRRDTEHKYIFMQSAFTRIPGVEIVKSKYKTVLITQFSSGGHALEIDAVLRSHDLSLGILNDSQRVVANFPLHSKEMVYKLIDVLDVYRTPADSGSV